MQVAKFGVYELDATAHDLRKGGTRVALQQQPFQVLALLVDRAGEVVTRDELRKALWPADTFVDFDRSLNTAVKKVRAVLNDPAVNPRFIETLPKVGYRFVAPVVRVDRNPAHAAVVTAHLQDGAVEPRFHSGRLVRWIGGTVVAIAASVTTYVDWEVEGRERPPAVLQPMPLTSYPGSEIHPALTPDGERVVFAWNAGTNDNHDIYIKHVRSGHLQRLTSDPADESSPAWSPDGSWIAFVRRAGNRGEAHIVPANGGATRKIADIRLAGPRILGYYDVLTSDPGPYLCWSTDGSSLIVADADPLSPSRGLYVVSVKTGQKRRLTKTDTVDSAPALSSDGRFLAFVRARGLGVSDIYLLNLSHRIEPIGEPRNLTSGIGMVQGPTWVRNGSELLFVSGQTSGRRTLQRLDIHRTSLPRPVPVLSDNVVTPTVASGARLLAYSRERADRNIWRVKLSAAGMADAQPQIVISSTYMEKQPQFSPDGNEIVFASSRSGAEEIWISDSAGLNARQLTHFNGMAVGSPRWSPDGTRIVFDGFPAGSGEIYIVQPQGGTPLRVTNDAFADASPSWSGDGRWIYFVSTRGADREVWKVRSDLPNAEPAPVTRTGATFAPVAAADGYVYYLKRGAVWRVPAGGGDERSLTDSVDNVQGYALAPGGLVLLVGAGPQGSRVEYLSLGSGRVTRVFSTPNRVAHIAVSRLGDSLLYTQLDEEAADLMLIQDFR